MPDANHGHSNEPNSFRVPPVVHTPAAAIFAVALLAALGAAGTVYGLSDLLGLGVAVIIAFVGAAVAAFAAGKPPTSPDAKATALLDAVSAADAPPEPPSRFRSEPWGSLYRRAAGYEEAQRSATLAVQEVESLRLELGKKPGTATPFEPQPAHADRDLVGAASVAGGNNAPAGNVGGADVDAEARAREVVAEAVAPVTKELQAIEFELDPLLRSLREGEPEPGSHPNSHPAKMLDALVRTAADGIEDLAAGLMRANELAGVAERVTNRATLLALNAALEATRSGSEAFASIAEETRRLAEYAREATDTISRLSNEIEMKVGETIGAIQTTSEDAKAAVESLAAGSESPSRSVAPETLAALEGLLGRVRALRERTEAVVAPQARPARPAYEPPGFQAPDSVPAYVTLDAAEGDEAAAPFGTETAEPPESLEPHGSPDSPPSDAADAAHGSSPAETPDTYASYGARTFEGFDPPPAAPEPVESADAAEADKDEADAGKGEGDAGKGEGDGTGGDRAPSIGSVPVLPRIPDWLEGLEPRDRR
jgi:hypothetical protein